MKDGNNIKKIELSIDQIDNSNQSNMETAKKEIEIVEVRGIPYFIDKQNQVYKHETIFAQNPIIIGEWNPQSRTIQFTN